MEQKNCPDPRNCTKIHYFGKCPYKHQPCNRGTSCPYVTQNNCQFYHPEEDYPQYRLKGSGKTKKQKRKPAITPVKITMPSATQLATMASKAFAEMAALQKDKPPSSSSQSIVSAINKGSSTSSNTMSQQQQSGNQAKTPMRTGEVGEVPIISHLTNPWGKAAKSELDLSVEKPEEPERIPEYITTEIKKQKVYIRDLEDRIRIAENNVELHRRRAEEFQSEKVRFFTWWSRAVKVLEAIRESGILLGEGILRTIEYHTVALRNEQNYASGETAQGVQKPEKTSASTYFSSNRIEDRCLRHGSYQQQDSYQRPGEVVNMLGQIGYAHVEGVSRHSVGSGLGSLIGYHRPEASLADRRFGQLGYQQGEGNQDNSRGLGQLVGYQRTNGNQENRRSLGQLGYQISDRKNQQTKRLGQLGPGYQSLDEAGERGVIGGCKPDSALSAFDYTPGAGFLRTHNGLENRKRDSVVEPTLGRNTFEQDMLLPSLDL